jgi:hypothetical protein
MLAKGQMLQPFPIATSPTIDAFSVTSDGFPITTGNVSPIVIRIR